MEDNIQEHFPIHHTTVIKKNYIYRFIIRFFDILIIFNYAMAEFL